MRRAYLFKLYPTRAQASLLAQALEAHRLLYNTALQQRRDVWQQRGRSVSYYDQSRELPECRREELAGTNHSSCQATLRRLDRAFSAFFRRLKAGERPGYPRFKGRTRFDSIEFPSVGDGCGFDPVARRIYVQHVGHVKVKLHRMPAGQLKTITLKRLPDGWHAVLSCDLGEVAVPASSGPAVGLDLGLTAFVTTSGGDKIGPPRFLRSAQADLRRAQRRVARRQKGSHRRHKAVHALAVIHQCVANRRRNWHHHLAHQLVQKYGLIAVEHLNIRGIARSRLAKSTLDAAWGQFLGILRHKAESAGVEVVTVPARNTSQVCSQCGALPEVPLGLDDRVYRCDCGAVLDRDHNAALNVLRLGWSRRALTGPK